MLLDLINYYYKQDFWQVILKKQLIFLMLYITEGHFSTIEQVLVQSTSNMKKILEKLISNGFILPANQSKFRISVLVRKHFYTLTSCVIRRYPGTIKAS